MFKLFRKYTKQLMALASVFLMVSWLATSIGGSGQGTRNAVVGTIAGQKFTQQDVQQATQEWQLLESQVFKNQYFDYESLSGFISGQVRSNLRAQHPDYYLALQREAKRMGMTATPDQVNTELTALKLDPGDAELSEAMSHYLAVEHAVERMLETIKVSTPAADRVLANEEQRMSANVVELAYDSYQSKVAEPTTQQVETQYQTYKSLNPETDPMGFGYLAPNRVELEWIQVPRETVRKAIKIPEVALWKYYKLNTERFQTTQPSSEPSLTLGGLTTPSPTTRPFTEVRDQIVVTLTEQATDMLSDEIVKDITDQMNVDWTTFHNAEPDQGLTMGTTTAPSGKPEDAYAAADYLPNLAKAVQQKQLAQINAPRPGAPYIQTAAILPTTDRLPMAEGVNELNKLPGIGEVKPIEGNQITFGDYVLLTSSSLITTQQREALEQQGAPIRQTFQPSRPLSGPDGVYIYRDRRQLGENPGIFELVRPKVVEDVRRSEEQTMAKADADTILKRSEQAGALSPGNYSAMYAGAFDQSSVSIPGLPLDSKAVPPFIQGAFGLLQLQNGDAGCLPDRRLGVVDLPQARSTMVVEVKLADVHLKFPDAEKPAHEFSAAQGMAARIESNILRQWLSYPEVAARNDIRLAAQSNPQPATPPAGGPAGGNIPIGQ